MYHRRNYLLQKSYRDKIESEFWVYVNCTCSSIGGARRHLVFKSALYVMRITTSIQDYSYLNMVKTFDLMKYVIVPMISIIKITEIEKKKRQTHVRNVLRTFVNETRRIRLWDSVLLPFLLSHVDKERHKTLLIKFFREL